MTATDPPRLNEAQQRVVDELGATAADRPTFPDGLSLGLREQLRTELEPLLPHLDADETLFVSKFLLSQALGCEVRHVHELNRPFAWSVPVARGTVAHKAIELSVHWRTMPIANELVDEALGSLSNDGSPISDYLRLLPEVERAQLRSEAANATQAFLDGFPPLRTKAQWRPAVEVRGRHELFDGRIVFSGKIDLSLGGPDGDRSGRVFIDLKTGRRSHNHRDDLRYYALIETMRYGTPPRMLATYYLDESRLVAETVTTDVLWAAADRVVAAASRHLELAKGVSEPLHRPSLACRWCPLKGSCEPGAHFLRETDDDDLDLLR